MTILESLGVSALKTLVEESMRALAIMRKEAADDRVSIDSKDARKALVEHVDMVARWGRSIPLPILARDKRLEKSFVELTLDLGLTRYAGDRRPGPSIPVRRLFTSAVSAAILGRPGAGKTTTLKRIAQFAFAEWETESGGIPVLVRLRDVRNGDTLTSYLLAELGIRVTARGTSTGPVATAWKRQVLLRHLETVKALLLIDGLDEVDPQLRLQVEDEIEFLSRRSDSCRILLTCRTADYHRAIEGLQPYTIQPLSEKQVATFARRWLGAKAARSFIGAVHRNPYAGAEVVPLTLAHLCAIYERDGDLPPRPTDVYETIISLLIEQWDRERGVSRRSKYSDFSWRKKERFLQSVAFHLSVSGRKGSFHHYDLESVYRQIAPDFGLPHGECSAVIEEIESHTGLVVASGHLRHDFIHLVIQEFLAGMHAHRTPNAVRLLVPNCPSELAIVTAYSSGAEDYLEGIIEELDTLVPFDQPDWRSRFSTSFLSRLAQERPTLYASPRLGWTLLAFLDAVALADMGESAVEFSPDISEFIRRPPVNDSLRAALAEAENFLEGEWLRIIPRANSHMASLQRARIAGRRSAGFSLPLIDDNVMELSRSSRQRKMRMK